MLAANAGSVLLTAEGRGLTQIYLLIRKFIHPHHYYINTRLVCVLSGDYLSRILEQYIDRKLFIIIIIDIFRVA